MSDVLARWNRLPPIEAEYEILPCCGSREWARRMAVRRPLADEARLVVAAEVEWRNLGEARLGRSDLEAIRRIGETRWRALPAHAQSAEWSAQVEQQDAAATGDAAKIALAEANREYEEQF